MALENENVTPLNDDETEIPPLKAPFGLKMLIIVLSLGIVGMLTLIIFKIYEKTTNADTHDKPKAEISHTVEPTTVTSVMTSGEFTIERPLGAVLTSTQVRDHEVVFQFKTKDGGDELIIFNRKTGEVIKLHVQAKN